MEDLELRVEKAIFTCANEDYCGLYEAIWELNTLFPAMALGEKYRLAQAALESLLRKGLIRLQRRTMNGKSEQYAKIDAKEAFKILHDPTSWYPEYPENVQIGFEATKTGAELWRRRGADGV